MNSVEPTHPFFAHEKLLVDGRALTFMTHIDEDLASWDTKHAVADHLPRATESIILNLAEGCRAFSPPQKQKSLDYSLGSTLECAACVDIARIKGLLNQESASKRKEELAEIARMLVGLRSSWSTSRVKEPTNSYGHSDTSEITTPIFHHEQLDIYRVALEFMSWFSSNIAFELPIGYFKRLDLAATSLILRAYP